MCVGKADNGWYEIVYPIVGTGFVSSKLVSSKENGIIKVTNNQGAAVHAGSKETSEQIGFINHGETYVCVGVAGSDWYEIVYPIWGTGFVSNKLVRLVTTPISGSEEDTNSYIIGNVHVVEKSGTYTRSRPSADVLRGIYAHEGSDYPCVKVMANGWYAILHLSEKKAYYVAYLDPQSVIFTSLSSP